MATSFCTLPRRAARCAVPALVCCTLAACGGSPSGPSKTAPSVTAITPNKGTSLGGTKITISGVNFAAGASVSIGGALATNVAMQNVNTLTATTGAHVAGAADVAVTVSGQTGVLRSGFTYVVEQVTNQPPTLISLVVQGTRPNQPAQYADLDEVVKVTATVQDAETPVSSLIFDWSADAGSFSGSGPTMNFTAPHATGQVTLRLKITERYTAPDASGLPAQKENTTFGTTVVDVHNSAKEVGDMAKDFLVLFSQSSVPADQVVHNFLDGCGAGGIGKQQEQQQVANNRKDYLITSWSVGDPKVTIAFDTACVGPNGARTEDSCTTVPVRWNSTCLVGNIVGCTPDSTRVDTGIDWVTARYDPPTRRWWLCDSDYQALTSTAMTPYLIK